MTCEAFPGVGLGGTDEKGIYFKVTNEKGIYFREKRPNFEEKMGIKTILGNRKHKKADSRILGNRGTSQRPLPL